MLGGALLVDLTQTGLIWEEGTSIKELPPSDWLEGMPIGHFLD